MSTRHKLSFLLHGHTFEQVIADRRSLLIECEACTKRVVWLYADIVARGFTGYVHKTAAKLVCSTCGQRRVFITVYLGQRVADVKPDSTPLA